MQAVKVFRDEYMICGAWMVHGILHRGKKKGKVVSFPFDRVLSTYFNRTVENTQYLKRSHLHLWNSYLTL